MADRIVCAALADAVYGDDGKINHELSIPDVWAQLLFDFNADGIIKPEEKYYTTSSGFAGAAYQNGNNIVISFRGTEPTTMEDILSDLQIGLNKVPQQVGWANTFAHQYNRTAHF